jgi:competence protein ComEC
MMKVKIRGILFLLIGLCLGLSSKSQTLEIHQIGIGQGDAALLVVRDPVKLENLLNTNHIAIPAIKYQMLFEALENNLDLTGTADYAVLIDAGDGGAQGDKICEYLTDLGVEKIDDLILSHYHRDHFGGFKAIIEDCDVEFETAWDRADEGSDPEISNQCQRQWIDVLATAGIDRRRAGPDGTYIDLKADGDAVIKLTCIAGNGYVIDDDERLESDDENDYSLAWILQYGAFRWYTGGDLNGIDDKKFDMETPMIDRVIAADNSTFFDRDDDHELHDGHICAFKIGHHGGQESTNNYFLSMMSPKVAMVSCGASERYHHPKISTLNQLDADRDDTWDTEYYKDADHPGIEDSYPNTLKNYYLTALMKHQDPKMTNADYNTFYKKIGTPAFDRGIVAGDIILVVDDNEIATNSDFAVYWTGKAPGSNVLKPSSVFPNRPASSVNIYNCHYANDEDEVDYIDNE